MGPVALLLVVGLLTRPSPAHGFSCFVTNSGVPITWQEQTVTWWLDSAFEQAGLRSEIEASFQTWQNVSCSSLQFRLSRVADNLQRDYSPVSPNQNVVVMIQSDWPYDGSALAVTTNTFSSQGQILDTDIELNEVDYDFAVLTLGAQCISETVDIRNTMTHEVGHLLGLDHPPLSQEFVATTMFAGAAPCELEKRTLSEYDIEAVCGLYPLSGPSTGCSNSASLEPSPSDDGGCSATTSSPSLGVLFLGLFWLSHRNRMWDSA